MGGTTKRMSAEEKRKVVLQIYHAKKEVYTEKEILTLSSKAGVNANTVADINQSLVDDGVVEKEKIGGSNYYWSFPAKKDHMMRVKHEEDLKTVEKLSAEIQEAQAELADAKRGREEDDDGSRAKKLQRLRQVTQERTKLEAELDDLKENDPQALADLAKELDLVTQGAHRWTDNLFDCKSFLVKKKGMDPKEACRFVGITKDFDYPEDK